jgi:hypothetical protein
MRQKTKYAECPLPYRIERCGAHSAIIRFTENAAEVDGGWEADEYTVVAAFSASLESRITDDFNAWLAHAKDADYDAAASEVRAQRDKLLKETDWTQVNDTPLPAESVAAYADYRQALRDIPQQNGFPYDVVWPVI